MYCVSGGLNDRSAEGVMGVANAGEKTGLRKKLSMQGICISTISYQMGTAVHGALGTIIPGASMVEDIEMRRRLQ